MAVYKSQFQMEVNASDKTKGVLTNLQKNLKKTGGTGRKGAQSVTDGWKKAVGALLAVKAAAMAVEGAFNALKAGREAAVVVNAFGQIHAGADDLLVKLREVSSHAIDDTSLQKLANRWKMAGKDMNLLMTTLPIAYKVAAATGEDYLQVAELIAKATATGRIMALQRYTGVIDELDAYKMYREEVLHSNRALTIFEQTAAKSAFILKTMKEKYGDIKIDLDVQKLDQVKRQFDNIVSDFQEGLMRGVVQAYDMLSKMRAEHLYPDLVAIEGLAKSTAEHLSSMFGTGTGQEQALGTLEAYQKLLEEIGEDVSAIQGKSGAILLTMVKDLKDAGEITADQYRTLADTIAQGGRQGLEAIQIADAMLRIREKTIEVLKTQTTEQEKLTAATQSASDMREAEIKQRAETFKAAENYYKLIESKAVLEANSTGAQNALEKLKLQYLKDQIGAAKESVALTADTIDQLDTMLRQQQMAKQIMKGVKFLFGDSEKKPEPKVSRGGGGGGASTGAPVDTKREITATEWAMFQIEMEADTLGEIEVLRREHLVRMAELESEYSGKDLEAAVAMEEGRFGKLTEEAKGKQKEQASNDAKEAMRVMFAKEQAAKQHQQKLVELSGMATDKQKALYEYNMAMDQLYLDDKLGLVEDYEIRKKRIEDTYAAQKVQAEKRAEEEAKLLQEKKIQDTSSAFASIGESMSVAIRSGAGANERMISALDGISKGFTQGAAQAAKYKDANQALAHGTIEFAGQAAAGIVKAEHRKAAILHLMEGAHAAAAFASHRYAEGVAHAAAGTMYGAIALKGYFGGGGKKGAKPSEFRAPTAATRTAASDQGGNTYHIHMSGIMAGTDGDFARKTASMLNNSKGLMYLDSELIKNQAGGM